MAFVVDVDTSILGDVPKRGRAAKPKTAPEPVFSMAKEKTIKGIKASIEEHPGPPLNQTMSGS